VTVVSVEAVLDLLPQTQCRRCGYDDCRGYAAAIAGAGADVNRCPPGGAEGIERLAQLTGRPALPLDPGCGIESPRALAAIDEAWCIGCALCLDACPVDAIVGAAKRMHTVVDALCTGCELCLPVCPVDCIEMIGASGEQTGWAAWSRADADQARVRYAQHAVRVRGPGAPEPEAATAGASASASASACASASESPSASASEFAPEAAPAATRHDTIAAALARARARAAGASR
jgi:H+/Na+-translocating ferredoxin:NAD+ oxidoreductase subunit B